MKIFLGVIGVFSIIGAVAMGLDGIYSYILCISAAQQQVAILFMVYSGILLLVGVVGLGFSSIDTKILNKLDQIIKASK